MTKNNETKKNVYVQPVCRIVQIESQQLIATSGDSPFSIEGQGYEEEDW